MHLLLLLGIAKSLPIVQYAFSVQKGAFRLYNVLGQQEEGRVCGSNLSLAHCAVNSYFLFLRNSVFFFVICRRHLKL